jgi:hypothetical protein
VSIKFFVEGKSDVVLVKDLMSYKFSVSLTDAQIEKIGGYSSKWLDNILPRIKAAEFQKLKPLIILDSDGDCKQRKQEIQDDKIRLNIDFDYFLLPNNTEPGNVESLLVSIVSPKHQSIISCFESYSSCLGEGYKRPDLKAKVFAYLEALGAETHFEKRDYLDGNWDLESEKLNPLYEFIGKYVNVVQV